jgi:hypothetical protein
MKERCIGAGRSMPMNSKWTSVQSVVASSKGQALFAFDQNAHMGALRRGMADDQEEARNAGDWRAIGNDEMYLEEVLNARVRLRYNGAVVQELRKWVRATESLNKRSGGQPYILFVDKVLYTTGRLTSEMVLKAARMGVPIVVSRNGVTAMGHEMAQRLGMTLFGRAANRRFLCYSGFERFDAAPELALRPPTAGIAPG